jgi:transcriptional regulator GlxA family with amidase domain
MRVGIMTTEQFILIALANFVDVLRLASDEGHASRAIRCQWHVMSTGSSPLRASSGFDLAPSSSLVDPKKLDYLAVVGGLLHRRRQLDPATRSCLLDADKAGVSLIGICTGSFVLCRLGLMNGRKCCVSWFHYRDFIAEFDDLVPVADESYVVDGDRITSAGGDGSALAAAHLVERHLDAETARKALRIMQIDYAKSAAALQPAPPIACECADERVARALLLMERHISEPTSIDRLTRALRASRGAPWNAFSRNMSNPL